MRLRNLIVMPLKGALISGGAVSLAAVLAIVYAVVVHRSPPRRYTDAETAAVEAACRTVARHLAKAREHGGTAGILYLRDDPSSQVCKHLTGVLETTPNWTVHDGSVTARVIADLPGRVASAAGLDALIGDARPLGINVVLAGTLQRVEETPGGGAVAELSIAAFDLDARTWLFRQTVTGTWTPPPLQWLTRLPAWARLLGWLAVVALLPWITARSTRAAVATKSNLASLVLLAAYTAVDVLLALALTGFVLTGTGALLRAAVALLSAAGYNYWACETIAAGER